MQTPAPRIVTLVLVDAAGRVLGALPPFQAATPWWMDIAPVVQAVQDLHGLRVVVLRLLAAEQSAAHGGAVSYLAELESGRPPALRAWDASLPEHPLRLPYARVGGPRADLAWASAVLQRHGIAAAGLPQQHRTWNLSSVWRLPTTHGAAWLKAVPPFFAHEGALLAALAAAGDAPVPPLLGHDGARVLLAEVPGSDRYGAAAAECRRMVDVLVALQQTWLGRAEALLQLGLPDWRAPALTAALTALLARRGAELAADDRALLASFVAALPQRCAALAACGLPDGLVHGDFHPGNFRAEGDAGRALTLLDWGDSGVGHPLLDQAAFLDRIAPADVEAVRSHWCAAWRRAVPPSDPERAARLLAPLAAARQALIYQRFLDGIEDSEQPYHRGDVVDWLQRTAARLRQP